MFLQNKYMKLYFKLVEVEDNDMYTEKHHVIPRCLGGSNDTSNLVSLSARKHFLCHYLLIKMVPVKSPEFWKLIKAFNMMNSASDNQERYLNSRLYEKNRKLFAESMSILQQGKNNSQYGTVWIYCPMTLISRKVPKHEIQTYLDNGCEKGRIVDIQKFINNNRAKENINKNKSLEREYNTNLDNGCEKERVVNIRKFINNNHTKENINKNKSLEGEYNKLLLEYYEENEVKQIFKDWKSSGLSLISFCKVNSLIYKYKNLHVKFKKFNLISSNTNMWVCNSDGKIISIKIEDYEKYKADGFKAGRQWSRRRDSNSQLMA